MKLGDFRRITSGLTDDCEIKIMDFDVEKKPPYVQRKIQANVIDVIAQTLEIRII